MVGEKDDETARPEGRRNGVLVALSVLIPLPRRRTKVTAKRIAEELYDAELDGDELFAAMWGWHDKTGIETRDMYAHYRTLQHQKQEPA